MKSIHTVEWYSAFIMNDIQIQASTWMNLENIVLSQIIQTILHDCTHTSYLRYANSEIESRLKVAKGWGREAEELQSFYLR